jgi:hypothetical protein
MSFSLSKDHINIFYIRYLMYETAASLKLDRRDGEYYTGSEV